MPKLIHAASFSLIAVSCSASTDRPPTQTSAPTTSSPTDADDAAPKTTTVDADTPWKTASGATFTVPKGWHVTENHGVLVLEEPDRGLSIRMIEVESSDAPSALASAWTKVEPGFKRQVKQSATPPPREGWEAITQITYETSSAESKLVIGVARKKGNLEYLALIEGDIGAADRRGAQLQAILTGFKAPGVAEESFAGKTANTLDEARLAKIDAFITAAQKAARVPGAAVAIIQGGKVVFEKGYGVRSLGPNAEKVTPNTLFMIGSISKQFTTLMMGKLVDDGKFTWDTPVSEVLPTFALGDPETTKRLTMRYTVCACTGLPRHDVQFFFGYSKATPEGRLSEMGALKPTTAFGEVFQYSNEMVSAGGFIAAHAASPKEKLGSAYDAEMQSLVFDPLGMKSTTLDTRVAAKGDHASPHAFNAKGEYVPMDLAVEAWIPSVRPAGGVWSDLKDMERDVLMELAGGKTPEGKVVISEANLLRRRKPEIAIDEKSSYGLGWIVEKTHGIDMVWHNGGTLGFTTQTMFLPHEGVGAIILTNARGSGSFVGAVQRRIFEVLYDGKEEAAQNLDFAVSKRAEAISKEVAKLEDAPDKEWVGKLAGTYQNDKLGKLVLKADGGHAMLDTGDWKAPFGRTKGPDGAFDIVPLDAPYTDFTFAVGEKGGKTTLTLDAGQEKYVFERAK